MNWCFRGWISTPDMGRFMSGGGCGSGRFSPDCCCLRARTFRRRGMRFPSPARKSASRLRQRKSRPMPNTLESGGVESRSAWWKRRPPTGVAGAVFWLALWFGLLWLLRQVPATSGALIGWMQALVGLALIGLAVPLTWRLIQKHLLWSLRNKLILTYLLIGLAPVVLFVTWATIFAYIAAGQFSIHLADTRMRQELDQLGVNNAVRAGMTARLDRKS